MLQRLASHNIDLKQLIDHGYAVAFDSNYLVVRDVPYLDEAGALHSGAIVSKVIFADPDHIALEDHQIFFCGTHPCEIDGSPIKNLGGGPTTLALEAPDLVVQRSFSNKPLAGAYANLFEKIDTYVSILSGPATARFDVTPRTFKSVDSESESVFKFNDTLTSRAEIGDLALKFKDDVIAVIGLGGTGAYLLDFLAKTPVKEIRAYDSDWFHIHNAYRSPGNLQPEELGKKKADVYQKRYEGFRSAVNIHSKFIDAESEEDLAGVTFAFVCVDKGSSRTAIFDLLVKMNIPFIDVGMGLDRARGPISGMMRVLTYSNELPVELLKSAPMQDAPNDIYRNNIQISELNALNACLAVIRYKQIRGFYLDDNSFHQLLLSVHDLHLVGES